VGGNGKEGACMLFYSVLTMVSSGEGLMGRGGEGGLEWKDGTANSPPIFVCVSFLAHC
jgi:hypothetical protein